jgi:uncharacterized protein
MRLVFDCNVLIRALLSNTSFSGQTLLHAKSSSSILLLSTSVFAEAIEVMMRPKFDKYVTKEIRQQFLEEFHLLSTKIKITERIKLYRDPKDNMYLELALSGKADCIISNDADLLILSKFENIPIITPEEFLKSFKPTY